MLLGDAFSNDGMVDVARAVVVGSVESGNEMGAMEWMSVYTVLWTGGRGLSGEAEGRWEIAQDEDGKS